MELISLSLSPLLNPDAGEGDIAGILIPERRRGVKLREGARFAHENFCEIIGTQIRTLWALNVSEK